MRRLLQKVFNHSPTRLAVDIAKALEKGDPYAHHWYLQLNATHKCYKCGAVALSTMDLNRTKCVIHTYRAN